MKLSTFAAIMMCIPGFSFALAVELEMEYIDIAFGGVTFLAFILLWIGTLLMELNAHFEKEEEKNDEDPERIHLRDPASDRCRFVHGVFHLLFRLGHEHDGSGYGCRDDTALRMFYHVVDR